MDKTTTAATTSVMPGPIIRRRSITRRRPLIHHGPPLSQPLAEARSGGDGGCAEVDSD